MHLVSLKEEAEEGQERIMKGKTIDFLTEETWFLRGPFVYKQVFQK